MRRNIAFAGPLADTFTDDTFVLDVDNWCSLLSALEANFQGFKSELRKYRDVAIYRITGDQADPLTEGEFALTFGSADTIMIGASEEGSEPVSFTAVASWLAEYGVTSVVAAAVVYVAVNIAIAYAASAAMQALSKSPSTASSTANQNNSYLFNGPTNPTQQGGAIPIVYGRFRVGGTVISSDITSDQLPVAMDDTLQAMAGKNFTANVVSNDVLAQYLSVTNWQLNGSNYGPSATISVPETTPTTTSDGVTVTGTQDNYTITLGADGTVTVVSGINANATFKGTYTALDSTLNASTTANVSLTIGPVVSVMGNDANDAPATNAAPGDAPGEGPGAGPGGSAGTGDGATSA